MSWRLRSPSAAHTTRTNGRTNMQQTHKFLSAETLSIPQFDRDALIAVLAAYERGELQERPDVSPYDIKPEDWPDNKLLFSMKCWHRCHRKCGSLCCIGGTAEVLAGVPVFSLFKNKSQELHLLFFYETFLNLPEAMQKLQIYLTTGKAPNIRKD
jgi:hypothetical protein